MLNGAQNLWEYMINIHEASAKVSTVFKAKDPKRYIQVKTTVINYGTQILAVCSDITRIKEMEKEGQILRSQFFSSVAHELRTPLNSIIPILKLMLDLLASNKEIPVERFQKYV